MKELDLEPKLRPGQTPEKWLELMIADLNEASRDRPEVTVPNAFTLTNFNPATDLVTTLDVSAPVLGDLAKLIATWLYYAQKQGPQRT